MFALVTQSATFPGVVKIDPITCLVPQAKIMHQSCNRTAKGVAHANIKPLIQVAIQIVTSCCALLVHDPS